MRNRHYDIQARRTESNVDPYPVLKKVKLLLGKKVGKKQACTDCFFRNSDFCTAYSAFIAKLRVQR